MRWHGDHVITTKLLRVMADDFKIESGLTFPHLQDHFTVSDGLHMDIIRLNTWKFAVFYNADHAESQTHYEAASFRCEETKGCIRLFSVWKYDKRLAQMAIRWSVTCYFIDHC